MLPKTWIFPSLRQKGSFICRSPVFSPNCSNVKICQWITKHGLFQMYIILRISKEVCQWCPIHVTSSQVNVLTILLKRDFWRCMLVRSYLRSYVSEIWHFTKMLHLPINFGQHSTIRISPKKEISYVYANEDQYPSPRRAIFHYISLTAAFSRCHQLNAYLDTYANKILWSSSV